MTAKQIIKKLTAANIDMSKMEISRGRVDVWADDCSKSQRIARKVAKALGWSNTGHNGSFAWAEATTVDMGNYNDKSSRWHY